MLKQRIITAVILATLLVVATTQLSAFNFALFISCVVLLASWEWGGFVGLRRNAEKAAFSASILAMIVGLFFLLRIRPGGESIDEQRVSMILVLGLLFWTSALFLLRGYPENRNMWNNESKIACMDIFALIPAWAGLTQLKYLLTDGSLVIAIILLVASIDIGAYFAGVNFGRRKLAPDLSPKKSWEGVWGGVAACLLVGAACIWLMHNHVISLAEYQILLLILLCFFICFFSIVGDLVESMLKRNQNMKDSSNLLPGHGGILDRVDGLIAAIPCFVLFMMFIVRTAG